MFWTVTKDFFRLIAILFLGFLSGFAFDINLDADIEDIDFEINELKSSISEMQVDVCDDFVGKLNIVVVDRFGENVVTVSFPFSYLRSLFRWSRFQISGDSNHFNVSTDDKFFIIDNIQICTEDLRNLKPGLLLNRSDGDTETIIWRSVE